LLGGGDSALEGRNVHVEGLLVDIDEHRRRAGQRHHSPVAQNVKRRAEHRVAGADALAISTISSASVPLAQAHHMLRAAERGEIGFELRHLGPVDELGSGEHLRHGIVDLACRGGGAAQRHR
jgi:hypothetical protein